MVTLRLIVRDPVPGVWGAIQQGSGSAGKVHEVIREDRPELRWEIEVQVKTGKAAGPFIQKVSKGQFVYILWGTCAGQLGTPITRRAKIYLPTGDGFPDASSVWEVILPGRAKDGCPCCATVKPLVDWQPAKG